MRKVKVTQEEWDKIADDFANRHAPHTSSLSEAMARITEYMSKYKIVKQK